MCVSNLLAILNMRLLGLVAIIKEPAILANIHWQKREHRLKHFSIKMGHLMFAFIYAVDLVRLLFSACGVIYKALFNESIWNDNSVQ